MMIIESLKSTLRIWHRTGTSTHTLNRASKLKNCKEQINDRSIRRHSKWTKANVGCGSKVLRCEKGIVLMSMEQFIENGSSCRANKWHIESFLTHRNSSDVSSKSKPLLFTFDEVAYRWDGVSGYNAFQNNRFFSDSHSFWGNSGDLFLKKKNPPKFCYFSSKLRWIIAMEQNYSKWNNYQISNGNESFSQELFEFSTHVEAWTFILFGETK